MKWWEMSVTGKIQIKTTFRWEKTFIRAVIKSTQEQEQPILSVAEVVDQWVVPFIAEKYKIVL